MIQLRLCSHKITHWKPILGRVVNSTFLNIAPIAWIPSAPQESSIKGGDGIVPPYMIGGKEDVDTAQPPKWTKRPNLPTVTKSWHAYQTRGVVQDFQASTLQISDTPYDEDALSNIPQVRRAKYFAQGRSPTLNWGTPLELFYPHP